MCAKADARRARLGGCGDASWKTDGRHQGLHLTPYQEWMGPGVGWGDVRWGIDSGRRGESQGPYRSVRVGGSEGRR